MTSLNVGKILDLLFNNCFAKNWMSLMKMNKNAKNIKCALVLPFQKQCVF